MDSNDKVTEISEVLILKAIIKCFNNLNSHKMTESDKKFLDKFEMGNGKIEIVRIVPGKCDPEKCGCGEIHWFVFKQNALQCLKQNEQNKLFSIAYKFHTV